MINRIKLKNFQSHKESVLDLDKGMNVIIGSSRSGKTAIIRALNWAINNRPTGLSYVSYWDRDKNKLPKEGQVVEVDLDNNVKIVRKRQKDKNSYKIINEEKEIELSAIGMDVPQEVKNIFNISEVNLQRQFDSPFLLSNTSGEVAKFYNRTIKLDLIDQSLVKAETKRRSLNRDIEENKKQLEALNKELENLTFINDLDSIFEKIKTKNSYLLNNKISLDKMLELINNFNNYQQIVNKMLSKKDIKNFDNNITRYLFLEEKNKKELKTLEDLYVMISKYEETLLIMNKYLNALKNERKILLYIKLSNKRQNYHNSVLQMKRTITNYESLKKDIDKLKEDYSLVSSSLPEICPVCKQIIKKQEK